MCDELTVADNQRLLADTRLTRRHLGGLTATVALASMLPTPANAADVIETDVNVSTPDGTADCYFVHPAKGKHAAVIVWPDILGLRPAFRLMGKRLAQSGYAVLVVNPYYRSQTAPVINPGDTFQNPAVREKVFPLARSLSAATNVIDARAFVKFLDAQAAVDTDRGIGTTGYCMGGPITLRTAAAIPHRISAAASFHGGRLVTDAPDSPHTLIPQMQAAFLIAVAANDDEKEPETKHILQAAFDAAELSAEIEVYAGAMHGWCPPDSPVYHEAQAERAWARLLHLFDRALA